MKRKLITQLLQDPDPAARLQELLPADDGKDTDAARAILAAGLKVAPAHNITTPDDFYFLVCSSTAEQLMPLVVDTPAAKLSKALVVRGQTVLKTLLTSNAGPPVKRDISRKEQLAEAQRRRREKLKNEEGRKQLNDWISTEAWEYLNNLKDARNLSRSEALNLILLALKNGEAPPTL